MLFDVQLSSTITFIKIQDFEWEENYERYYSFQSLDQSED